MPTPAPTAWLVTTSTRRAFAWLGHVAAALTLSAALAGAQTVTGTVVLPDSTIPVSGAIVAATDSAGTITRALTAEGGRFLLRLPHAGRHTIQVLRIGFVATRGPTVTVAPGDTATLRLVASSARVTLAAIEIRGRSQCRVRPDTSLMVARVWEEARKAMLATGLTAGPRALHGEWMRFSRTMAFPGGRVMTQRVRAGRGPTTTVFQSADPPALVTEGYVVDDETGTTFHAPDANVLLSEQFVATHCFQVATVRSNDPALIGVRFEPASKRRSVRDIEGTVWVDRASGELRLVDFAYTNLPPAPGSPPGGGIVEFTRLASGSWIVSSWIARLPLLEREPTPEALHTLGQPPGAGRMRVRAVEVAGGEVSRVSRDDSVLLDRAVAAVRLRLSSDDPLVPVAGASVVLEGTDYSAIADASGLVTLGPLPEGAYHASIVIPRLDSSFARPFEREVTARRSGLMETVKLASAKDWLGRRCARDASDAGEAILRGSVRAEEGIFRAGIEVSLTFAKLDARSMRTGMMTRRDETLSTVTDARGRWQFCGLPHDTDLELRAAAADEIASQSLRLESSRPYPFVELELAPDTTAGRKRR